MKLKKKSILSALAVIMIIPLNTAHQASATPGIASEIDVTYAPKESAVPGQYIVTLRGGESVKSVYSGSEITPFAEYDSGFAARLSDDQILQLKRDSRVAAIEEDQVFSLQPDSSSGSSISADLAQQYAPVHLDRIDQRTLINTKYNYVANGSGVTAYVIDSGIDKFVDEGASHEFDYRAWQVADFVNDQNNRFDCNGHGTHVAGIIGSKTYGVAKNIEIRGIKVLDCAGKAYGSSLISAVNWVRKNAVKPAVVNMSVTGGPSLALDQAVTALFYSGVFVGVAAGNQNTDACNRSPASSLGSTTVAAAAHLTTNGADIPTDSTNGGPCVDLFAIGSNVQSTWLNGTIKAVTGSSMAAPAVTGVAALLLDQNDNLSSQQLRSKVLSDASVNVMWGMGSVESGTPNRFLYKQPSL